MSQRIIHIALATIALFASFGVGSPNHSPDPEPKPTQSGVSPAAQELIDWGGAQYADAGLELPDVTFMIFDSLQQCDGRVGRYDALSNILWMCQLDSDTMLHELAHAWVDLNLTEADHSDFVALRNLDSWNDRSQLWKTRGTEQAAEVLVWALSDLDKTVAWVEDGIADRRLLTISDSSPERLAEAYEQLTGQTPYRRSTEANTDAVEPLSPEAR
jgi:hypothetical protein